MTRIITITSGVPGVGKTHLAVNISLELVRRGRQAGLFHSPDGSSPIDRFIDIRPLAERRQPDAGQEHRQVISRGYLGIDILSCEIPLAEWSARPVDGLLQCIHDMDVECGYDDFIVDTSGMMPRELLGCCLASPVVVMVVTPDRRTQAAAFALLRVLRLNGFAGELRLLVNRVAYAMDAGDIYRSFSKATRTHLDFDTGMLEVMLEDQCIPRSEHYRQAFSAVFPDSEAAAGIVVIADDLDDLGGLITPQALPDYWERFVEIVKAPLYLPGKVLLEGEVTAAGEPRVEVRAGVARIPG